MANDAAAPRIEVRQLAKAYGDCVANRSVSFSVRPGSIHALVGENGAGKSTCMKMLYGLEAPDSGAILISGTPVRFKSPRDAVRRGIGMVHQHFMLASPLTGLDNVLLGAEPAQSFWGKLPRFLRMIDRSHARETLRKLATDFGIAVDLDRPVGTLAIGLQQRLEILKLLYRHADTLILDEPTAVLTPNEVDDLFRNLRRLRSEGRTIIIITHKLREVLALADDVTVMRRGESVASRPVSGLNERALAELMVGRPVQLTVSAPAPSAPGAPSLEVKHLSLGIKGRKQKLRDLNFSVKSGEIVGIAGIEGNGQSELMDLLQSPFKYFRAKEGRLTASGSIKLFGQEGKLLRPAEVLKLGVGIVPEDRHRQGLLLSQNLEQNFLLGLQRFPPLKRYAFINGAELGRRTARVIHDFDIRPATRNAIAGGLSGGNQQKLIMARALERNPKLLFCAQPTRGVDVGSIEFIHRELLRFRAAGCAILLVSSELDEITALSDRILVLFEGRIVFSCARGESDERTLGEAMGGGFA